MSNEDTLEHKIKSVDQNLDDKFELVIEEANTLQKNIAESIQANNKSLKLFENVSLKYIIPLSGVFGGFTFFKFPRILRFRNCFPINTQGSP